MPDFTPGTRWTTPFGAVRVVETDHRPPAAGLVLVWMPEEMRAFWRRPDETWTPDLRDGVTTAWEMARG